MKKAEYILLPLLSIAVGAAALWIDCFNSGRLFRWFPAVVLSLFYLGIPGTWLADRFRSYPERVRLSPISFGLIAVIPAALMLPYPYSFYAGNIVMALTVLSMARFKPGARLGIFKPIPFKATLAPFAAAIAPMVITIIKKGADFWRG